MKKSRKSLKSPPTRKEAPKPDSLSELTEKKLVPIDASTRRARESSLYEAAGKNLESLHLRLKEFENKDVPAFTQWLEREFSRQLDKAQALLNSTRTIESTIESVRFYSRFKRISLRTAYAEIMDARENGTEAKLWEEVREALSAEEAQYQYQEQEKKASNPFRDLSQDREKDEGLESDSESDHNREWISRKEVNQTRKTAESYLKSLYRQLARLLHPDTNKDFSKKDQQIWQEVQEAYSSQNVATLQRLMNALNQPKELTLDIAIIPIGDIIALRRNIEKQIQSIKTQLNKVRHEPSWNFCKIAAHKSRLEKLKFEVSVNLDREKRELNEYKKMLERQLHQWGQAPRERGSRSRGKKKMR